MYPDDDDIAVDMAVIDQQLREMAPLLSKLAEIDTVEASPHFVAGLRERLHADHEESGPDSRSPELPQRRERFHPFLWTAAALAALLSLLLTHVVPGSHQSRTGVTIQLPYPSVAELTRNYPPPPGPGLYWLTGTRSLYETSECSSGHVTPYYGPLQLTTVVVPSLPSHLPAYQLAAPLSKARFTALARQLHVTGIVSSADDTDGHWLIADTYPGIVMHSLALSLATGEVDYQDQSVQTLFPSSAQHLLPRNQALKRARTWLKKMGWPGDRMPLRDSSVVTGSGMVIVGWDFTFGWPGIPSSTEFAATMSVTAKGEIAEACLLPSISRTLTVEAEPVAQSIKELRSAKVPLAVNEYQRPSLQSKHNEMQGITNSQYMPSGGKIWATDVKVTLVRVSGGKNKQFLVPVYRFSGSAHLTAHTGNTPPGTNASWYALVPAFDASTHGH